MNSWCSFCSNHQLCDNNDCNQCFEKSFASHEKAKFWNESNITKPRYILKGTHRKYKFNCDTCIHIFETSIGSIVGLNTWCPFCGNQQLCDNTDCSICYEKSFASHEKSKYWSNKNKTNPRNIFAKTKQKYIFNCNICNHEFNMNTEGINKNAWCQYCANNKLCDDNNCDICFEKSFASHEKVKYWSSKNKINPRKTTKGSDNKFWFECNNKHNFEMCVGNITRLNTWCPYCKNKTEQKIYEKLLVIYPNLIHQYRTEWCKNKTYLPFDFVLEDIKIIIELDGIQHFKQIMNWALPEKTQEIDKYKMSCANNNGFSVIRILQEDVFKDTYNWLDELKNNVEMIIKENKIQNIYMCKNNEYDIYL
jgi:very-short-patch-repair endonuclease